MVSCEMKICNKKEEAIIIPLVFPRDLMCIHEGGMNGMRAVRFHFTISIPEKRIWMLLVYSLQSTRIMKPRARREV